MATTSDTKERGLLAEDYRKNFTGKIPDDMLDRSAKSLGAALKADTAYPANGAIASILFWLHCRCNVEGGMIFTGDAFGLAVPGGSALFGDLYTDNLDKLYAETRNFTVVAALTYTAFIFQDEQNVVLGTFHAGAVGTSVGSAYGSGKWEAS